MLKPEYTAQFKRDYKKAKKRGCDPDKLAEVVQMLCKEQQLPVQYHDHPLNDSKYYKGSRECHITPDWLLIYRTNKENLLLTMIRTGSHGDLFK